MRTTPREKLVLWVNGLALAVVLELLLSGRLNLISAQAVAVVLPAVVILAVFTGAVLSRRPRRRG